MNQLLTSLQQPSIKFFLKEKKHRLKQIIRLVYSWRWQFSSLPSSKSSDVKFYYLGRKSERTNTISFLGLDDLNASSTISNSNSISDCKTTATSKAKVLVSEMPFPGAICLPLNLSTVISLKNQTIDDILMGFEKRKRRLINCQVANFKLKKVTNIDDVIRLNEQMLKPFANARYGQGAYHFPIEQLIEMTFKTGQFNLLLHNDKEVGCTIGHFSERNKKRYWQSDRMGFPEFIFSESQQYRETNVVITYLQIQWAIANGFEYYDMGANAAYTEAGVLHNKRTFGGQLSLMGNYNYLYLKLPAAYAAKFYWQKPLFALEDKAIVLHLGLLDGVSDSALLDRYKTLDFGGIEKVYLHFETQCSENALMVIKSIFSQQNLPPLIVSANAYQSKSFEPAMLLVLCANLSLLSNSAALESLELLSLI